MFFTCDLKCLVMLSDFISSSNPSRFSLLIFIQQLIRFLLPNAIFELRIASCIIMRVCTYMDALKTNAYCTFWGVALDGRSQLLQTIKFTYA